MKAAAATAIACVFLSGLGVGMVVAWDRVEARCMPALPYPASPASGIRG